MARTGERIDRKTLKQDALLNYAERAGEYVRDNMNVALGILAAIVVLGAIGFLWRNEAAKKASQADETLSQVVATFSQGQFEQTIQLSTTMQSSNAGSKGAVAGLYFTGASQLRLGRFAEAEQALKSYLEKSSKMPFYETAARRALAAAVEGQGRHAEAATMFQDIAAALQDPQASEVQMDAARALRLAGNADAARAILQKLAAQPTNPQSRQAKIELAVLESQAGARP